MAEAARVAVDSVRLGLLAFLLLLGPPPLERDDAACAEAQGPRGAVAAAEGGGRAPAAVCTPNANHEVCALVFTNSVHAPVLWFDRPDWPGD